MSGMNYNQSDIILLRFPFSDLSSSKQRPALILSSNSFNESHDDIICCLITTNLEKDPLCVFVEQKDLSNGSLEKPSKIKPYRLFSAEKKIVRKKVGTLKPEKFNETMKQLRKAF